MDEGLWIAFCERKKKASFVLVRYIYRPVNKGGGSHINPHGGLWMAPWALQGPGPGTFKSPPGPSKGLRLGPGPLSAPLGHCGPPMGPCGLGPCGPLSPCGPGPCGHPGPLWAGPMWTPWALVGPPEPLWAGPLWAHWALVGHPGPLRAEPLCSPGPHGLGPNGTSWNTCICIYVYVHIYLYKT